MKDEEQLLAENYEALKHKRALLLTEREKTFNGILFSSFLHLFAYLNAYLSFKLELPDEVSQILNCLTEPPSLPSRHLQIVNGC